MSKLAQVLFSMGIAMISFPARATLVSYSTLGAFNPKH